MAQTPDQMTPGAIRAAREQTRERMTVTLNRIQERLDPRPLVAQAKEGAAASLAPLQALARDVADRTAAGRAQGLHFIRSRPVAVGFAALVATWVVVRALKSHMAREALHQRSWRH